MPATPQGSWSPWKACANKPADNCASVRTITRTSSGTVFLGGDFSQLRSADGKQSIAASNLFTRNVYTSFIRPDASPEEETRVSQLVSLLVKLGALVFVLGFDKSLAINLQLLGGIWVVQTFPAVGIGLYTRWLDRWGLLAGWAAGMAYGTYTAYDQSSPAQSHFGSPLADIPFVGHTGYIALTAFVLNMVVAVAVTALVRAFKVPAGPDETSPDDYTADADDRLAAPEDPAGELTGQSA